MNWKKMILKEKYHGPPRRAAGDYKGFDMEIAIKRINHHIENLTMRSENNIKKLKTIDVMIPYHIKKLQELIDEMDENIIEDAKYGGPLKNYEPHEREDFNPVLHGAKFRSKTGRRWKPGEEE
jgi:hypothetical protein